MQGSGPSGPDLRNLNGCAYAYSSSAMFIERVCVSVLLWLVYKGVDSDHLMWMFSSLLIIICSNAASVQTTEGKIAGTSGLSLAWPVHFADLRENPCSLISKQQCQGQTLPAEREISHNALWQLPLGHGLSSSTVLIFQFSHSLFSEAVWKRYIYIYCAFTMYYTIYKNVLPSI